MKKETDRCSFPQNLFDPLQKKAYLCSKLLEVFKTKARYNWGMRSSNAFEKALKHYDFH